MTRLTSILAAVLFASTIVWPVGANPVGAINELFQAVKVAAKAGRKGNGTSGLGKIGPKASDLGGDKADNGLSGLSRHHGKEILDTFGEMRLRSRATFDADTAAIRELLSSRSANSNNFSRAITLFPEYPVACPIEVFHRWIYSSGGCDRPGLTCRIAA